MKTLCTFTRITELRHALPAADVVTLMFAPAHGNAKPYSFLAFVGGQGVIVDAVPNALIQSKQWQVYRHELDQVLAAFERSRVVTVADEQGALVMTAGGQSVMLNSLTPAPQPTPNTPAIRPIAPRPAAPEAPAIRAVRSTPPAPPAPEPPTQTTQAFKILDAALRLSAASNGAPILERLTQGYEIVISDAMGYQFDISQQEGTVITLVAGSSRKNTRYPALRAPEWDALLEVWKNLTTANVRRSGQSR